VIDLINNLGSDDHGSMNTYHVPNSTNLHTHALHVSPEGNADNVFALVSPGKNRQYVYELPTDHSSGTFWYHPHLHGSTTLQVGGGAAGVIIVEDVPGTLPSIYESMPERILMLQNLPIFILESVANYSSAATFGMLGHSDELHHLKDKVSTANTNETNIALINGAYRPSLQMEAGKWQRWRIVNAAPFYFVDLTLDGCELQLLQKDGVYLNEIPRAVSRLVVPTGGRVDVAVKCPAGHFVLGSGVHPGASGTRNGNMYHNEYLCDVVVAEGGPEDDRLPMFKPPPPAYLKDLRAMNVGGRWDMNMTPLTPKSHNQTMFLYNGDDGGACKMNDFVPGESMPWKSIHSMELGKVEEWKVGNLQGHPFHLHVNHFQVVDIDDHEYNYTQVGDWMDTLELVRPSPTVITRLLSDTERLLSAFASDADLRIVRPLSINGTILDGLTWGGKSLLKLAVVNGITVSTRSQVAETLKSVKHQGETYGEDVALKFKPSDGMYGFATIRLLPDRFIGQSVLHCHFLNHEDLGCIATASIHAPNFLI
jgi:FtsP/CotA-like multicopper oxidase with cupredoxin domain